MKYLLAFLVLLATPAFAIDEPYLLVMGHEDALVGADLTNVLAAISRWLGERQTDLGAAKYEDDAGEPWLVAAFSHGQLTKGATPVNAGKIASLQSRLTDRRIIIIPVKNLHAELKAFKLKARVER